MTLTDLQLQIVWDRLLALVEEQAQTLMRTAFSTPVREAGDLSAGIFDLRGRMLAQAVTGTPGHVNAMAASVGKFLERHPIATLEPGDVLITNDPWHGTGHLNDFTVVTPTFSRQRCVGLFAATSHVADVGGLGFGADGRDVYEEGLNVPISYLFRRGEPNETLFALLKANVRDPISAQGDWFSLAACNETAGDIFVDLLAEFDLPDLEQVADVIVARSEAAMLDEIRKLPVGTYRNRLRIDGYDTPLDLVCEMRIGDGGIGLDFAGSAPASDRGINVPLTYTTAYASFGVRCIVGGDIPNNAGSLGVVRVSAPEDCLLNAQRPAAVSARHAVGQLLPDLVLGCLEGAVPERVPAEGASCLWNPVLLSDSSNTQQRFVINPFYNGGTGARPGKDGLSTTAFPSGVRNTPSEINEATAPVVIWRKEYLPDSGGPGEYRGGLGQIIEVGHLHGEAFRVSKMFDRVQNPAGGRRGGHAGRPGAVYTSNGTQLRPKGTETVPSGETLILELPGGGGLGQPHKRSAAALRQDVRDGLVSERVAAETYRRGTDE